MTTFLLFCVLVFAGWFSIAVIGAYGTDWQKLAKTYRTDTIPRMGLRGEVVGMGWEWASPDLLKIRLSATQEGLFLSVHPIYAVMRPPLLIPWKDFRAVLQKGAGAASSFKLLLADGSNILVTSLAYRKIHPFLTHLSHAPAVVTA